MAIHRFDFLPLLAFVSVSAILCLSGQLALGIVTLLAALPPFSLAVALTVARARVLIILLLRQLTYLLPSILGLILGAVSLAFLHCHYPCCTFHSLLVLTCVTIVTLDSASTATLSIAKPVLEMDTHGGL